MANEGFYAQLRKWNFRPINESGQVVDIKPEPTQDDKEAQPTTEVEQKEQS